MQYYIAFLLRLGKIVLKAILLLIIVITVIFLIVEIASSRYIQDTREALPTMPTAIVFGASTLSDGTLSSIFKDRVDMALWLFREGKVQTILVTGDNGRKNYNEVTPAGEYLLAQGVPQEAIFLDYAGFDTYSSMYRARDIFLVKSAIIVTQSFHLPRGVFIARSLGIDAYGIPSDQHAYLFKNNIREVFANVKAVIDVVSNRIPKFLGKEIPITP